MDVSLFYPKEISLKNPFYFTKETGPFFAAARHEIEMSKIFKHIVKATDH